MTTGGEQRLTALYSTVARARGAMGLIPCRGTSGRIGQQAGQAVSRQQCSELAGGDTKMRQLGAAITHHNTSGTDGRVSQ